MSKLELIDGVESTLQNSARNNVFNFGADKCPSFAVYESELKPLLLEVFRLARPQLEALIEEYIQMYKQLHQGDSLNRRMEALRGTIDTVQKKKQKLLSFNAQGALSDRDFLDMNAQCTAELEAAEAELEELTTQRDSAADFQRKIDTIPAPVDEAALAKARIKYLTVAPIFAEAIERTYQEISIAKLFN